MKKRNLKTKFLILLRRLGMLCRKPHYKPVIRVSHTVYPDEEMSQTDVARHVFIESKKLIHKDCEIDGKKELCEKCGATLDYFLQNGCKEIT
jgi:hypothetical protein